LAIYSNRQPANDLRPKTGNLSPRFPAFGIFGDQFSDSRPRENDINPAAGSAWVFQHRAFNRDFIAKRRSWVARKEPPLEAARFRR
jgi:hypothetical protein